MVFTAITVRRKRYLCLLLQLYCFLLKGGAYQMARLKFHIKADKFLDILSRRDMSQTSFARWARLTSGHMSQLVRGVRSASPETQKKILLALPGVDRDEIFSKTNGRKR
jgi:hypothetical protein